MPFWLDQIVGGGQEHDVIGPNSDNRVYKLTKRNEFGLFPHYYAEEESVGLRPASPLEYFDRLLMQNEWFGDDTQLEGIGFTDAGSVYTLTSQPFVQGRASTLDEISGLLSSLGFREFDPELAAWKDDENQIVLSDAHPRNLVTDSKGRVLPIDLIIGRMG
ncbi:MAG: hypothetical protein AAF226_03270 [Verrucomicrobiota bacterium]